MKCVVLLTLVFASNAALACRCAEQTLGDYFATADEVFAGTLQAVTSINDTQQSFNFDRHLPLYKSQDAGLRQLPYVSHKSSAACAVSVEPGAVYVVFAQRDEDSGLAWLTSCNGTRIHRSVQGERFGFADVPERYVISQLSALAGLEALRKVAIIEPVADDVNNRSVLGLLDVAAFTHTSAVPVFNKPGQIDADAVKVSSYEDLQHRESGYEVDAALVYAVVDGWYKIKLSDGGFGWLAPDAAGTFWSLETLLPGRLAYLIQDWNRFVWPDVGAGIPLRLSYEGEQPPREQAVNIIGSRRIAQSLWLEVEVLQANACEGKPEKVLARGWVPAYTESGDPAAWFYSRGC